LYSLQSCPSLTGDDDKYAESGEDEDEDKDQEEVEHQEEVEDQEEQMQWEDEQWDQDLDLDDLEDENMEFGDENRDELDDKYSGARNLMHLNSKSNHPDLVGLNAISLSICWW
jgi:hypothetical protein